MSDETNKKHIDRGDNESDDIELDTDPGDDVVFEDNTEVTGSDHQKKVKQLKERLKEAEEKAGKYLDAWQRDKAEFINVRKRDEQAQGEFLKFANEKLILEIITVLDHFDNALKHLDGLNRSEGAVARTSQSGVLGETKNGVEQIRNQFISVLEKNGVTKFSPLGEVFDPARAEAIAMVAVENSNDDHTVMEVIQAGYELNGRVIRPAIVKVGEKNH